MRSQNLPILTNYVYLAKGFLLYPKLPTLCILSFVQRVWKSVVRVSSPHSVTVWRLDVIYIENYLPPIKSCLFFIVKCTTTIFL